jgi:hypothetical protein
MERTCVEVVARLGDTLLDVAHHDLGTSYRIGTSTVRVGLVEPTITIGLVTITMTLVPRPKLPVPRPRFDRRPVAYLAAALIAHTTLWAIAVSSAAPEPHLAERAEMKRQAYIASIAKAPPPPPPKRPRVAQPTKRVTAAPPPPPVQAPVEDSEPATPKGKAIARARKAGFLEATSLSDFSMLLPPKNLKDLVDQTGPIYDEDAANAANFGGGGGGPKICQTGCDSISTGEYATVSTGRGAGDMYTLGGGPAARPALVKFCTPKACAIDDPNEQRSIRLRIEERRSEYSACYEQLAKPGTRGTVTIQLVLDEEGTIVSLKGRGLGDVARCIAGVVSTIYFRDSPRGVHVTYPISFVPR